MPSAAVGNGAPRPHVVPAAETYNKPSSIVYFRTVSPSRSSLSIDGREWRNTAGALHRDDGPAIEYWNGDREWWRDGQVHRDDGPAVEFADGSRTWYQEDELHRVDGPAVENVDGMRAWLLHGQLHREDGPALVHPDGTYEWHVHGRRFSQEEHRRLYSPGSAVVSSSRFLPNPETTRGVRTAAPKRVVEVAQPTTIAGILNRKR